MLDVSEQRELARRAGELFRERGLDVVFVGSTAVVGLGLYDRTSKDADALAAPETTMDEARNALGTIAAAEGLALREKGWGTISLANLDDGENVLWEVDLIVPGEGMVPPRAAERIHARALHTDIGRTASPEHVLVMKAIAYGDCAGKGQTTEAAQYENDLLQLRQVIGDTFDWREAAALAAEFQGARRRLAASKVREVFGRDLDVGDDVDPSVA